MGVEAVTEKEGGDIAMDFDEKTAVEKCRRELDCLAAAMQLTLRAGGDTEMLAVEHYVNSVERLAEELDAIANGRAATLVAPSEG